MSRASSHDTGDGSLRRWVVRHPIGWGAVSGLLAFALFFAPTGHLAAVVPALVFGVLNWYLWRENGPGRLWAERASNR